eukprot:5327085-Prorocentrum_lima.AAC.1
MTSSLVGSEMCIRDRFLLRGGMLTSSSINHNCFHQLLMKVGGAPSPVSYTHLDAADDMQCVDLG